MVEKYNPESNDTQAAKLRLIEGGIDTSEPLRPYLRKHNNRYDCTFLDHPLLHKDVAEEIAFAIVLRLGKLEYKRQGKHPQHIQIEKFMLWLLDYLGRVDKPFTSLVKQSLAAGEKPDREGWQMVVDQFRSTAIRTKNNPFRTGSKCSRNFYIDVIRGFLTVCVSRGVFPSAVLNGIKGAHKEKGKRKILGDLQSRHLDKVEVERLVGGYLQDRVNDNDIIADERVACITALASSGLDITGLTDGQIMEEIKRLNTERLAEVRRCAEADFIKGWETYQEGQQLLVECDLSYEEDMRDLVEEYFKIAQDNYGSGLIVRQHPFREMFLGTEVRREETRGANSHTKSYGMTIWVKDPLPERVAKSRLLTLIDGRYGHGPHVVTDDRVQGVMETHIKNIWRATFRCHGLYDHRTWAKERLGASLDTLLMAQIILLIDTGLNTEVVDDLTVDCVRDTDIPTIKEIWGIKGRAGNQPVVGRVRLDEAEHQINSIEVIQRVKEMTRRLRRLAKNGHHLFEVISEDPSLEKRLFIRERIYNVPKNGSQTLVSGIKNKKAPLTRFMKEHPTVDAYNFTVASIRPTVRMLAFMNGEDIETSRAALCHGNIATTTGYVMRTMSRMEMEARIREFMKHYEAIVIQDIPGAAKKLGYTADEYEKRLAATQRTGLGTICDHLRKDAEGNEFSLKQKDCDPVEECPTCPLARVFPALKENLVDAFLMRGWIRGNEVELRSNEERWRKVWMRWLAIVEGVIDKAKTAHSVSRKTIKEAEEMAEEIGAANFLPLI